mgnify:CR=1 FL=1
MCKHDLRHFRTISGPARRLAIRAHLSTHAGIDWTAAHTDMTTAQRRALEEMAAAVSWRKSIMSPLTMAGAFFVYLARDVKQTPQARDTHKEAPRKAFVFGRRHA